MDSNEEKLRLLFVEEEVCSRKQGVNQGAEKIFERWPSYVESAVWCIVFIVSLATLLLLTIFVSLIYERSIVTKVSKKSAHIITQDIQSEICSPMIAKHEKRQDIPERDLKLFDSGKSVFYVVTNPLDKFSSCSVESVIQHSPDKNIFMLFLQQVPNLEFENVLKVKYSNFNLLHVAGSKVLKNSPFEGRWQGDERSLFEVALLLVWQFGGMVLSEHLFMMNNKFLESPSIDCKVDSELIYCPVQCAAYLYDFIGVTLHSARNTPMSSLLDGSIKEFCGSENLMKIGCMGVKRLDEEEICDEPSDACSFVRTKKWVQDLGDPNLWQDIKMYCPITRSHQATLEREDMKERTWENTIASKKFTESKTTKMISPFTTNRPGFTTPCMNIRKGPKKSASVKSINTL